MLLVVAIVAALLWLPTTWGIVAVAAAAVVEVAEAALLIWVSKRRSVATGAEALPGARGVVAVSCRPDGQVRVAGELWQARCPEGADTGEEVVVEALERDLVLLVRRGDSTRN